MTSEGGDDMRVQLTRIEGGINLLNERHETVKADIRDIREQQHRHSNRLGVLEASEHQRRGAAVAIKIMWALGGSGVAGALALIARSFAL